MKNLTINEYSDAGHGWLRVPKELIIELGIADKISKYSYINHNYVYLEEDCDCGIFLEACEGVYSIKTKPHYSNHSRIRSYYHYNKKYLLSFQVGTKFDTIEHGEVEIYKTSRSRFYLKNQYGNIGYSVKNDIVGLMK